MEIWWNIQLFTVIPVRTPAGVPALSSDTDPDRNFKVNFISQVDDAWVIPIKTCSRCTCFCSALVHSLCNTHAYKKLYCQVSAGLSPGPGPTRLRARARNRDRLENRSHVVPKTEFQDGGGRTRKFTHKITIWLSLWHDISISWHGNKEL